MQNELKKIKEKALDEIKAEKESQKLRELEIKYLGRKGELTKVLRELSGLSLDEKKKIGSFANEVKQEIEGTIEKAQSAIRGKESKERLEKEWVDATLPVLGLKELGSLHSLTQVQNEIEDIFNSMGFMILDGPELESEYYNFEALNIPSWHPARDMQDTFYASSKFKVQSSKLTEDENRLVMRTQTSPVQVRAMQKYGVPIKLIAPGRVFRNEATDASHEHTFYQVEGLMVGENISLSNLFAVSNKFLSKIFHKKIKTRFRPGYFPFVEPGLEMDLECTFCGGKGCRICKYAGWIEFMGAGMVHPHVLEAGGADPKKYNGFAFGFGITRLVMMKYGIDDIRLLLSGDLRFLRQF